MSKMSRIAAALDEQAVEYGLQGYQEALERGFTYEVAEDDTATLRPPLDEQEMAHKVWLEEKQHALDVLDCVADVLTEINEGLMKTGDVELAGAWSLAELTRETKGVAEFIKRGEC